MKVMPTYKHAELKYPLNIIENSFLLRDLKPTYNWIIKISNQFETCHFQSYENYNY